MICLLGILLCLPVLAQARFDDKNDKDNEALQKEALALNNVRSKEAVRKKLTDLGEDRKHQKRLVQAAVPLAQKEDQPFNYSAAHILGVCAMQTRESTAAITFLKIAIDKANKVKSDEKLLSNRFYLSRAYLADNKPVDAQKVLEKIISMRPNPDSEDEETVNLLFSGRLMAENELVRCYMAQGKFDKADEQVGKLEKDERLSPKGKAMIQESKAGLLHYKGDVKGAIKIYEQLSEEAESDEEKESYKELIGNLYGDINEMDKAEKLMGELLKKKPDNAGLNNDLGFMMADHDRKLDEAERMIKKAVDLEPENSSYLDSMAWVLYKKKQFKPAKEWMLKAVAQERGKNTELMEHLGDIHLALGEKSEAKAAYEKAIAAATPNFKDQKRKTEIEKKIKDLGEK
jgi:tetratricopeptide (TPR) repeat protein